MSPVGRNDPCPCGSGKKLLFTAAERQSAIAKLMHFATRPEFHEDHQTAHMGFWGDRLDGLPEADSERVMALEQSQSGYITWFAFDFPLENDRTLAEILLEREGAALTPGEREYLERVRGSHVRLYEVTEVKPDEGLRLLDLWTNEEVWVRERLATRQLVRWDLVGARLMTEAKGDVVLEAQPYLYPPLVKDELVRELRWAHREFTRRFPRADLTSFFKYGGVLFHHFWLDHMALRPPPSIITAEGDPVIFAKAVFDVRDRAALLAVLAAQPSLRKEGEGHYVWIEEAQGGDRLLGSVRLEGKRLVLETTSRQRAERGRQLLASLAGDAITFRATRYEDVDQAISRVPPGAVPRDAEVPPELAAQAAQEYHERHYQDWLDRPIPVLGNRTPHHAARLKTVRPKLIALLKDMEARSARQRQEGKYAYDFSWMWHALGIDQP